VRAVVKAALPAFNSLAVRLLANVTQIALDGSTCPSSGARVLEENVSENLDDGIGNIAVVILTAHITALAGEVVAIAHSVFLSSAMIFVKGLWGWMRAISVEPVTISIDGDKFLGFQTLCWQCGGKKLLRATHDCRRRPQLLRRWRVRACRFSQLLI